MQIKCTNNSKKYKKFVYFNKFLITLEVLGHIPFKEANGLSYRTE